MSFIEVEAIEFGHYRDNINKVKCLINKQNITKIEEFKKSKLVSESKTKTVSIKYHLFFEKQIEVEVEPEKREHNTYVEVYFKDQRSITLEGTLETIKAKLLGGTIA